MGEVRIIQRPIAGVGAGAIAGFTFMFFVLLVSELAEPAAYSGGLDPLPNFWAGDFRWRVMVVGMSLFGSAIIGSLSGGIVGRIAIAIVRRGIAARALTRGLVVFGGALGAATCAPASASVRSLGVLAVATLAGGTTGLILARVVTRSWARGARAVEQAVAADNPAAGTS